MTGPLLLPYQRRWVRDPARFKVANWSRQIGKTFASTFEICFRSLEREAGGKPDRWVILSVGERQAREAMETGVKRHLNALEAAFRYAESEVALEGATVRSLEVTLGGGSRITALPANPATARGFSANVLLDEFAHHRDSRAIWQALYPVVSAGFDLRVCSTPNGRGNKFYELMTDPDLAGEWSRHTVTVHRAVEEGLDRDPRRLRAALGDPIAWRQEFECEFVDEASAWLTYALIDGAEDDDAGDPAGYRGGPCWAGMDIAARGDLTVIAVLEEAEGRLVCRELVELRGAAFSGQLAELDRVLADYRVVRAALDQTGMGEMPVEAARQRHGSRVEGVLFTAPRKLDLATALREALEERRLRLPRRPELRRDLHSVRRAAGPTGAPRLVAERGAEGHADRFWALALAAAAAKSPREHFDYHPARPADPDRWARTPAERDRFDRPVRATAGFRRGSLGSAR